MPRDAAARLEAQGVELSGMEEIQWSSSLATTPRCWHSPPVLSSPFCP